jgi:hypothetical protein
VKTKEVRYEGFAVITQGVKDPVSGQLVGQNRIPVDFTIKAMSIQEAFELYDQRVQETMAELKEEYEKQKPLIETAPAGADKVIQMPPGVQG